MKVAGGKPAAGAPTGGLVQKFPRPGRAHDCPESAAARDGEFMRPCRDAGIVLTDVEPVGVPAAGFPPATFMRASSAIPVGLICVVPS
jgi:hypothetical protein